VWPRAWAVRALGDRQIGRVPQKVSSQIASVPYITNAGGAPAGFKPSLWCAVGNQMPCPDLDKSRKFNRKRSLKRRKRALLYAAEVMS
jgi:hypothetical protein